METFLITAAFVALLIMVISVLVMIETFTSKRRRQSIIPLARAMGFSEVSPEGFDIKAAYPHFLALSTAHLIHDFIIERQLEHGIQQHIFDIELRSGNGQSEKISLCLIHLPGINLPTFLIKGRDKVRFTMRLIHDVGRAAQSLIFQYHPVTIQSEAFAKQYQLMAPDSSYGFEHLFTPELVQKITDRPNWQMEGMGDWLLFYQRGTVVKARQFNSFTNDCMALADAFNQSRS
ncbi:hypothetical protein [Mariprofundus sp. KV]|uniref:hypothetical protein n=1 Tax=Mariprofundus sp. KV TaxID=2608715 RepID=UPI0015A0006C|nr:hypothetical protein [Mariprofundus sp. KV]NWF37135.1 hypothetical protein [Mariprofundus sp. KV]